MSEHQHKEFHNYNLIYINSIGNRDFYRINNVFEGIYPKGTLFYYDGHIGIPVLDQIYLTLETSLIGCASPGHDRVVHLFFQVDNDPLIQFTERADYYEELL